MVIQRDALSILADVGAFLKGHFVLTHGDHSERYFNKDALYPYTEETSLLCRDLALFMESGPDVVAGPAMGGVILSHEVARHLTTFFGTVLGVYAEPGPGDALVFRRGYEKLIPGKKVFVVDDVLTTGGSARKVVEAVRALGGKVVGVGALYNRGGVTVSELGNVPWVRALINVSIESYNQNECPLCKAGVPVNIEVGKGREFLARKAAPLT